LIGFWLLKTFVKEFGGKLPVSIFLLWFGQHLKVFLYIRNGSSASGLLRFICKYIKIL